MEYSYDSSMYIQNTGIYEKTMNFSIILTIVVALISWLIVAIGQASCLKKAGEKAWKAFIPIYGPYLVYKISGMNGAWILTNIAALAVNCISIIVSVMMITEINDLRTSSYKYLRELTEIVENYAMISSIISVLDLLASIATLIATIFLGIAICRNFNLGGGYVAGMILVPFVFYYIIGFGSAEYHGNYVPKDQQVVV